MRDGTATTESRLTPGDLVPTPGSAGTLASPGHVVMFVGHGLVVEAPPTGDVVNVVTYASLTDRGVSTLRHID
jgi:cell wall-associated NlpC family hydrolase